MSVRCAIRPGAYFDSVVLMRIAAEIGRRHGVCMASMGMATPANKDVLADAGLLDDAARAAGPSDLVIALDADDDAVDDAIRAADDALADQLTPAEPSGAGEPMVPRSLSQVDASLALISTPGRYAAAEALKALRAGMSAFIFSDNVPVDQEILLKREAHERGLIVMGPDCGTAIVAGVPLGFANEVRRGEIGLIGASGTGLQQVSTLIDRWGAGVSHAIGVGGHDLSAEVGAISMLDALDALDEDPETKVIVLISKPPDAAVAEKVLARAAGTRKPVIAAFLGAGAGDGSGAIEVVGTLEEAARAAVRAAGGAEPPQAEPEGLVRADSGDRRLLRALYAGGTFAHEATVLLKSQLGVISDDADPPSINAGARLGDEHLILDLGDDRFTVGRPHPMIDPTIRIEMLRAAGEDPRTAVIVVDVVLGHGAAEDPAGDLAAAIAEVTARKDAPLVVAFVVGTATDPQGLERQEEALRAAGAHVAVSSTAAVRAVGAALAPAVTA
jgi:FdrA protein